MLCKFYLNCRKNRTRKCIKEKSRKKKYPLELHHPKPNTLHTLFQFMFYSKWDRGQEGWMASPTQWTWVWASSRSWWWTGTPSVLQSIGLLRQDWETELNWCSAVIILTAFIVYIVFKLNVISKVLLMVHMFHDLKYWVKFLDTYFLNCFLILLD